MHVKQGASIFKSKMDSGTPVEDGANKKLVTLNFHAFLVKLFYKRTSFLPVCIIRSKIIHVLLAFCTNQHFSPNISIFFFLIFLFSFSDWK